MKSVLAELNMEQFRRVPLYESYMANEITEEQYHAELMDYEEAHCAGNCARSGRAGRKLFEWNAAYGKYGVGVH